MTGLEIMQRIRYYENVVGTLRKEIVEMISEEFNVMNAHDRIEQLNDANKELRKCKLQKYKEESQ